MAQEYNTYYFSKGEIGSLMAKQVAEFTKTDYTIPPLHISRGKPIKKGEKSKPKTPKPKTPKPKTPKTPINTKMLEQIANFSKGKRTRKQMRIRRNS